MMKDDIEFEKWIAKCEDENTGVRKKAIVTLVSTYEDLDERQKLIVYDRIIRGFDDKAAVVRQRAIEFFFGWPILFQRLDNFQKNLASEKLIERCWDEEARVRRLAIHVSKLFYKKIDSDQRREAFEKRIKECDDEDIDLRSKAIYTCHVTAKTS